MLKQTYLSTALMCVLGLGLISCGGGSSSTDRISPKPTPNLTENDVPPGQLGLKLPFYTENVDFNVYLQQNNQLITRVKDFSGADVLTPIPAEFVNQSLRIEMVPQANARIFDIIENKLVNFDVTLNAITKSRFILLGPTEEAVYQRALALSGQYDFTQPDPTLIKAHHLSLAVTDINRSLDSIFTQDFPSLWNENSLTHLSSQNTNQIKNYVMTYKSLGHLKRWAEKHNSSQSYSDFVKNISIDLRDGYLDGNSIHGDTTSFVRTVSTTANLDPSKNTLFDYAALQQTARETVGNEHKFATLEVALSFSQPQLNPVGYKALADSTYVSKLSTQSNSTTLIRLNGAGDYTRAFGFTHHNYCSSSLHPCLQGLNADTSENIYSDIEALVGIHKGNNCSVHITPFGHVSLNVRSQAYISTVNRDIHDHALRLNDAQQHYILNVGSGESPVPFYIQLEVKAGKITKATAGHSSQAYPEQLDEVLNSCTIQS